MQKTAAISLLFLTLLAGFMLLNARAASTKDLPSPQIDQITIDPFINDSPSTQAQLETNPLSEVDVDLDSTQLADFAIAESPAVKGLTLTQPIAAPTPIPTPKPNPRQKVSSTPKPTQTPDSLASGGSTPDEAILSKPSSIPTPTPIALKTNLPTPQAAPPGSLSGDKIFKLVNDYRLSKNLPALEKDDRSCTLAASRAPEIMGEVRTGTMHKGLADRKLSYWNNENIAYYNTEEETVKWWASDYIHRKQLEGNFKYSCVACYKNACAEELTNFQPK